MCVMKSMRKMESPDKITPRTLVNQFTEQQGTTQPVTRGRKHVERTPKEKFTPGEKDQPLAKHKAPVRRSPRHSRTVELESQNVNKVPRNHSRQVVEDYKNMDSPDKITPRTMVKNFTDQQKTTQPVTRKRKQDEKTPHERPPSGKKSSLQKHTEPARKRRRSSLMKKAMINSLNTKETPRTIIQQFVEEVTEETPVQPPLRRSSRLSDVNSEIDTLVTSIKQPTPIEVIKTTKANKGMKKSKSDRTLRNYSFTSQHQKELTADTAVQAEEEARLVGRTEMIGDRSRKELEISSPQESSEIIPSSRSPSPSGKSYKPSGEKSLPISSPITDSSEWQSDLDKTKQSSVGQSAFSNRKREMIVSVRKQRNASRRNIPSDSLSDSDVFAQTVSYSASDEASPAKSTSIRSVRNSRNLQKTHSENQSQMIFSDHESIGEHSSQVDNILNSLSSSRGGSPVHSVNSGSRKSIANSASKICSPSRRSSRYLQINQEINQKVSSALSVRSDSLTNLQNDNHSERSEDNLNSMNYVEKRISNLNDDTIEFVKSNTNTSSKHSTHDVKRKTDSIAGSEKSFHSRMSLSPASSARIELRRKSKLAEEPEVSWIDSIDASNKSVKSKQIEQNFSVGNSSLMQSASSQRPGRQQLSEESCKSFEGKLRLSPTLSSNSSHRSVSVAGLKSSMGASVTTRNVILESEVTEPQTINGERRITSASSSSSLQRRKSRPSDGPPLFQDGNSEPDSITKQLREAAQTSVAGSREASSLKSVQRNERRQSHMTEETHIPVSVSLEALSPRSLRNIQRQKSRLNIEEHIAVTGNLEAQSPGSVRSIQRRKSQLNDETHLSLGGSSEVVSPQSMRSIQRAKSRLNIEEHTAITSRLEAQSPESVSNIQRTSQLNDETHPSLAESSEDVSPQSMRSIQRAKSRLNIEEHTAITSRLEAQSPESVRSIQRTSQLNDETHPSLAGSSEVSPRSLRSIQRAKSCLNADESYSSTVGNLKAQSSRSLKYSHRRKSDISDNMQSVKGGSEVSSPQSVRNIQRRSHLNDEMHISDGGDASSLHFVRTNERVSQQIDENNPSITVSLPPVSSPLSEHRRKNQLIEFDEEHRLSDDLKSRLSPAPSDSGRTLRRSYRSNNSAKPSTRAEKKNISPDKNNKIHNTSPPVFINDSRTIVEPTSQHHRKSLSDKNPLSALNDHSEASLSDKTVDELNSAPHSGAKFITSTPHVSRSLSHTNQFSGELSLSSIECTPVVKPSTSRAARIEETREEETTEFTVDPNRNDEDTLQAEQETVISKVSTKKAKNLKIPSKAASKVQRKCSIPRRNVKSVFNHFAKCRVSRDAWDSIESASDKFFKYLVRDLEAYTAHGHRKSINEEDVELLMKRQGFVTDTQSVYSLVEKYLPLEDRREIIPMARSGNKILP